eukprot:gene10001-12266_t
MNKQIILFLVVLLSVLSFITFTKAQECSTSICGGLTEEVCCGGYVCDESPICCDLPGTFVILSVLSFISLTKAQECSTSICGGLTEEVCCEGYTCRDSPICCDFPGTYDCSVSSGENDSIFVKAIELSSKFGLTQLLRYLFNKITTSSRDMNNNNSLITIESIKNGIKSNQIDTVQFIFSFNNKSIIDIRNQFLKSVSLNQIFGLTSNQEIVGYLIPFILEHQSERYRDEAELLMDQIQDSQLKDLLKQREKLGILELVHKKCGKVFEGKELTDYIPTSEIYSIRLINLFKPMTSANQSLEVYSTIQLESILKEDTELELVVNLLNGSAPCNPFKAAERAAQCNRLDILRVLYNRFYILTGKTMMFACINSNLEMMKFIDQNMAETQEVPFSSISYSIKNNHLEGVAYLLDHRREFRTSSTVFSDYGFSTIDFIIRNRLRDLSDFRFKIVTNTLIGAALYGNFEIFKHVLQTHNSQLRLTADNWKLIFENTPSIEIFEYLLNEEEEFPISQDMIVSLFGKRSVLYLKKMEAALGGKDMIVMLLGAQSNISQIFSNSFEYQTIDKIEYLEYLGYRMELKKSFILYAINTRNVDLLQFFLKRLKQRHEIGFEKKLWDIMKGIPVATLAKLLNGGSGTGNSNKGSIGILKLLFDPIIQLKDTTQDFENQSKILSKLIWEMLSKGLESDSSITILQYFITNFEPQLKDPQYSNQLSILFKDSISLDSRIKLFLKNLKFK